MIFFNIENISILIVLNEKVLFLFRFVEIYSNIVSFQPLNRIRLGPMGAYSRWGSLIEGMGLNRGEGAKSRTYGNLFLLFTDELPFKGIIDILNEVEGNTDEDLLIYALTLVNKVSEYELFIGTMNTVSYPIRLDFQASCLPLL